MGRVADPARARVDRKLFRRPARRVLRQPSLRHRHETQAGASRRGLQGLYIWPEIVSGLAGLSSASTGQNRRHTTLLPLSPDGIQLERRHLVASRVVGGWRAGTGHKGILRSYVPPNKYCVKPIKGVKGLTDGLNRET